MKDTNEIEKQLKRKADAYIEQKANEMYAIHQEIHDSFAHRHGVDFPEYETELF